MSNQATEAPLDSAQQLVHRAANWTTSARSRIAYFFTAAHRIVTLLGIAALFVLGLMFFNPDLADRLIGMSPFSDNAEEQDVAQAAAPPLSQLMPAAGAVETVPVVEAASAATLTAEDRAMLGSARQQKLVTGWLAKRYRVANDAADMLVSAAYLTAKDIKLDPLLILSVIAIESRFNPFAESPMGAQGLMQVMSKVHHDKFQELGGIKAALNPVANIRVGSQILKEYVTRGGSVEAGLKTYVGAAEMNNDGGYGVKVLSEYQNLKQVAMGKNISIFTTNLIKLPPAAAPSVSASAGPVPTSPVNPATPAKAAQPNNIAAANKPKVEEQLAAL
ncbi:lytic transglycosylase domain-containing protein [Herbaspirillum lusitanum]|uniref:Lytic transglycosylase domain-containing protein n=1 Tax=Herbaspirillum lusitanum TaxID=213312 RepID=A0ABW9A404_9BURK